MKRLFAVGLALALAAGCTSTTNNTAATGGSTADTAAAADSGTASDAGSKADTAAGDTAAPADTKTTDTAKADVKKDVSTAPEKCNTSDSMCLQGCATTACSKEATACDAKCTAFGKCVNACQSADLPADPTAATCAKKCIDSAGTDSPAQFYAAQSCVANNCMACDATDAKCQDACTSTVCIESLIGCLASYDCTAVVNCLNTKKCKDAACAQGCMADHPNAQATIMDVANCLNGAQATCTK